MEGKKATEVINLSFKIIFLKIKNAFKIIFLILKFCQFQLIKNVIAFNYSVSVP